MVKSCCAYACTNEWTPNGNLKFHKFPFKNPDKLQLWLRAIKRQNFKPSSNTVICSNHFTESDYLESSAKKNILKRDAVPSVFNFPDNVIEGPLNKRRKLVIEKKPCTEMAAYTEREKMLLVQLVIENNIVENKRTDNASLEEKRMAWELISTEYNSQPEVERPRTAEQLRKLWSNLKHRKRKQNTEMCHGLLPTSGGPGKKPAVDPVLDLVPDVPPHLDVTTTSPYDSTIFEIEQCLVSGTVEEEKEAEEKHEEEEEVDEEEEETNDTAIASSSGTSSPGGNNTSNATGHFKRITLSRAVMPERNARIQKVKRATEHDEELHNLRMQVFQVKLEKVQLERRKAASEAAQAELKHKILQEELLKLQFEKQKAAAVLSLENYKKQVGGA